MEYDDKTEKLLEEILQAIRYSNEENNNTYNKNSFNSNKIDGYYKDVLAYVLAAYGIIGAAKPEIGLLLTFVTALTSMAAEPIKNFIDEKAENRLQLPLYLPDELAQAFSDHNTAFNEKIQEAKKGFDGIDLNTAQLQELWDDIKGMVDNNGDIMNHKDKNDLIDKINSFNDLINKKDGDIITFSGNKMSTSEDVEQYIKNLNQEDKKGLLYSTYDEASTFKDVIKDACILVYAEMLDAAKKNELDIESLKEGDFDKVTSNLLRSIYADDAMDRMQPVSQNYKSLDETLVSYLTAIYEFENFGEDKEYDVEAYIAAEREEIFNDANRIYGERFKSVAQLNAEEQAKIYRESLIANDERKRQEQQKSVAQLNAEETAKLVQESYIRADEELQKEQFKTVAQLNAEEQARIFQKSLITNEYTEEIADLFQNPEITGNIAAVIESGAANAIPAAAQISPVNSSSTENSSGCCCKMDVDKILEGLNKPITITLYEEEIGKAVLKYENNLSQQNGM